MSDRSAIFGAIKSANRAPALSADQIAEEAAQLVANPPKVQPAFDSSALLDRFVAKTTSERVTATVDRVPTMGEVPAAVSRYLKQVAQTGPVSVQDNSALKGLDWSSLNRAPILVKDGGIAVTLAEYGIAETGSVVFRSGANSPILLNFLPLYHIVVLKTSSLVAYPEDLWSLLGGRTAPQSRVLTIVTGTSGTADIEAKNVRGAHGPRYMHIVIVLD
jgi:L-lactate dehydrogenase complex protein LldG